MNEIHELRMKKKWDVKEFARTVGVRPDVIKMMDEGGLAPNDEMINIIKKYANAENNKKAKKLARFNHPIVITSSIYKGGTGKSSTFCNLAQTLASRGYFVLMIDADGQSDTTSTFLSGKDQEDIKDRNIYEAIVNVDDIKKHIHKTDNPLLDIVPSSYRMANIEDEIYTMTCKEQILNACVSNLVEENLYDFVFIDTNNQLASFCTTIWLTSNPQYLFIVAEGKGYSVKNIPPVMQKYSQVKKFNKGLDIIGILFNKVEARTVSYKESIELVDALYPGVRFESYIRKDSNINKAQEAGMPLQMYKRTSNAMTDYETVADELISRILEKESNIEG